MNLNLKGKRAIITGGSKGIGRAIALALAAEGVSIATCARERSALEDVHRQLVGLGVDAWTKTTDLSGEDALIRFMESAFAEMGRVDILVNNVSALTQPNSAQGWRNSINIDLLASVSATQLVIPWMKDSGGGNIIFLSTVAGMEAGGTSVPYSAVKAALISYAKNLALVHAIDRIRVNTVAPGAVDYPGGPWDQRRAQQPELYAKFVSQVPWGRMGTPDEVANVVVFLASESSQFITGACIPVDGGKRRANI
jgi:3-oxoacyl-[acyl-carrier protein] reductase